MFGLIKKMFIRLLISIINASNHRKCVLLGNEYSQEFCYYPFAFKLDRCVGSCNTLKDLSNKVCVLNKTEDLNLSLFNMITGMNESKTLTKHILCECKCKFDGRKCNSNQWWRTVINVDVSVKNVMYVKNIIFGTLLHDDSAIMGDEIIESFDEETTDFPVKTIPTNFNEKKATCKTQNDYILLAFLLITIAFSIAVSIYCYMIKYRAKQKHLLPCHFRNNELKEIMY